MPAPPAATPRAVPVRPKPHPPRRRAAPPPPPESPPTNTVTEVPEPAPIEPANIAALEPMPSIATGEPAPLPELPLASPDVPTLPPRLDLAYKVYLGSHGFLIGEATYRFEHTGNAYHIATVGQARGLAALVLRGQGKLESRGLVTATGLQPLEFAVERGSADRREVAQFDWESGIVTLHEDKTEALELPAFDPLTVMWQPYFSPPTGDRQTFSIATTRRVTRYTVTREGVDRIEWTHGEVEAERWHRRSDDGQTDAYVWLAPALRYVPVKMRISRTMRGTVEVVLDSIRIEEASDVAAR
jgi:hypothetical protein